MTWLYVAAVLIALGVIVFVLSSRAPADRRGAGATGGFSAPRVKLGAGTRGRCPECGAKSWPGAVKCWNCGYEDGGE